MKKIISILLTMLLIWCPTLTAAAAETATAATLRLEKTEGTVKVANAAGKSVKLSDGMRLYSGYTISTQKNSYAYISLDSNKAVKLDASSKCQVQKSGNKLELRVISGKLFFNVSAPVKNNESLNIRTSTMVTGVRGTSGVVEKISPVVSKLYLIEGTVTVTSTEPATGQMRQAVITGGQTATATLNGDSETGRQMSLTVGAVKEEQIPGFVAVEVEKDPALQRRIKEKSPLSIPKIIGDAAGRLKGEQQTAEEKSKKIEENLKESGVITEKKTKPVFKTPTGGGGGGGGSSAPALTQTTLDNPTAAELQAALASYDIVNVENAAPSELYKPDDPDYVSAKYEVASGKTLNIISGTMFVGIGETLTVDGTMNVASGSTFQNVGETTINGTIGISGEFMNSGKTTINGTMNVDGTATNNGTIEVLSDNSLHVKGTLTNYGTINVGNENTGEKGWLDITGNLVTSIDGVPSDCKIQVFSDSKFSIIARTEGELIFLNMATDVIIADGTTIQLTEDLVIPSGVTLTVNGILTSENRVTIHCIGKLIGAENCINIEIADGELLQDYSTAQEPVEDTEMDTSSDDTQQVLSDATQENSSDATSDNNLNNSSELDSPDGEDSRDNQLSTGGEPDEQAGDTA